MKLRDFINQWTMPLGTTLKRNSFGDDWRRDLFRLGCPGGDWTVIDAGAHRGETLQQLLPDLPQARFHAFEPAPDSCAVLREKWGHQPNVSIHAQALGATSGRCSFYTHPDSATNSLLPKTDKQHPGTSIEIEKIRLDDWARTNDIGSGAIHLLKMDCQGTELDILKGAQKLLSEAMVHFIYTEVLFTPLYEGQCYFEEIVEFLRQHDIHLVALYDGRRNSHGHLLWSNALFSLREFAGN